MFGKIKITPADIILIASLLSISGLWFIMVFVSGEPGAVVEVNNAEGLYKVLRLDDDARIIVPGPLGESILRIENREVFMESSPCPSKVCIHTGKINSAGESIVCIPNRVFVFIRSEKEEIDSVTY